MKHANRSPDWGRGFKTSILKLAVCSVVFRYGEAAHPGPDSEPSFRLGIFNPSGLTSKVDILSALPGDIWLGSETHLSADGIRRLRCGLHALRSHYTYVIPGAPCGVKRSRAFGEHAGVIALSRYPARSLAHAFPPGIFESARIQIVGVAIGPVWVQAGVLYGFPDSKQHLERTFRTDTLLDALVDRIGLQADGPRVICGDFNHGPEQLAALDRLRMLGFREIQEVACYKWSHHVRPTSKGKAVIDQMWLSVEMQSLLCDIQIHDDHWADHCSVEGVFHASLDSLSSFVWHMPSQFPWPAAWECELTCDWSQPTMAYAALWHQLESAGGRCAGKIHVPSKAFGRGQTLQPQKLCKPVAPCRRGRADVAQPRFFGSSLLHVRWFRQLRRIQALLRMRQCNHPGPCNLYKMCEVWRAIRHAPGFESGFCRWWADRFPSSPVYGCQVPSADDLQLLFDGFRTEVRTLERKLQATRFQSAQEARRSQPHLIFKDCARERPEVLDSLVNEITTEVEAVDSSTRMITFTQQCAFDSSLPIVVQGIPRTIQTHGEKSAQVDSVDAIQIGDSVRQQKTFTSDESIMQEFARVWTPRWNKLAHVQEGQWKQITDFCSHAFGPIAWNFQPITHERLATAFRHKKRTSATGPDGVSRVDLLALPMSGRVELCKMFDAVEQGGVWPQQLVQGFVNSLHKGRGHGVDAYRPIVVYPITLRTWSTLRARDALHSIKGWLPPSVRGGIPGGQAKAIWFQISQLIEAAYALDETLVGLAVDIQRAFNALPRWPIWFLLAQLDCPYPIVHAWSAFLGQQERRFKIRRSVSPGHRSLTGFPEGCALSVFSMALVDMMLDAWLGAQGSLVHSLHTYVDDWHVLASSPSALEHIWDSVMGFSKALDLDVDEKKSFVWATHSQDRKALQGGSLKVHLASKALGAHHNFSRKKGNKAIVDRVAQMQSLWSKLRSSASPYAVKVKALLQVAWPRAFYGISVVFLGKAHFQKLRTGALRGLKADRVGANPVAHLASNSIWSDPEAWSILQAFRETREVGGQDAMTTMLQFVGAQCDVAPPNGPAAILAARGARLGWKLCSDGCFLDRFGKFSVFSLHWDALVARIKWAWPHVLSVELAHRWTFEGIQNASFDETSKMLAKYSPQDQVLIRCALDGTLYQDAGKQKEARGHDSSCVFCGQRDSAWHRNWECPHFQTCRDSFPWGHLVHELPKAQTCHGWPLLTPAWFALQHWFCAIPVFRPVFQWPKIVGRVNLFTDGTCAFPKEPSLRFSSWSLTCAIADASALEHRVLACAHTTGQHQTAFRAELEAVVVAIETIKDTGIQARIWCDCLSVVRGVQKLQNGGCVKPNRSHSDLWNRIATVLDELESEQLQMVKVVSHAMVGLATDEVEVWAFWQNRLADEAANSFNFKRSAEFWQLWEKAKTALFAGRKLHADIMQVILRVARHGHTLRPPANVPQPPVVVVPEKEEQQLKGCRIKWGFTGKLVKLYKYANIVSVHEWWLGVGVPALQSRVALQWVSGVHLFLDFFFSTGSQGVISPVHGKWFTDISQVPDLQLGAGKRAAMFVRLWTAYIKSNGMVVGHKLAKPTSSALQYWCMCWRLPWAQSRIDRIDAAILRSYGHQVARPGDLSLCHVSPPEDW